MRKFLLTAMALIPSLCSGVVIDLKNQLVFPYQIEGTQNGAPNITSTLIDATGEQVWGIMQMGETAKLRNIGFNTGTTTTGDTITFRLESINSAGNPSGNLFCANSSGTVVIANTDDNVYLETGNMVADCTVGVGTYVAVGFLHAGAFNGNIGVRYGDSTQEFAYSVSSNSASGFVHVNALPILSLKKSDGNYVRMYNGLPSGVITQTNYNNTTNPNHRGNYFRLPVKSRAIGCRIWMDLDFAASINIWQYGSTKIATATISVAGGDGSNAGGLMDFYFDAPVWLNANEYYRIILQPTSASNNTLYDFGFTSATHLDKAAMMGSDCILTTANNPTQESSWTQTNTRRSSISILVDEIDVPGGGFGVAH